MSEEKEDQVSPEKLREKIKALSQKYRAIVEWNHRMQAFDYYIEAQLMKAELSLAPEDAIYYLDEENGWVRVCDLKPNHPFREWYEQTRKE